MRKKIIALALILTAFVGISTKARAAVVSLLPIAVNTTVGQTITVPITVDPEGTRNYTSVIKLSFPADLLTVTDFTYSSQVVPLVQSGYDSVDNTNGMIVKSAGFPKGITGPTVLGTVTFRAKQPGTGVIRVLDTSSSLNESGTNTMNAAKSTSIVVQVATPTVILPDAGGTGSVTQSKPKTTAVTPKNTTSNEDSEIVTTSSSATSTDLTGTGGPDDVFGDQTAATATSTAGGFFDGKGKALTIGIIVLIILIAIIASMARRP